jgi:hypothetical protein
MTVECTGVGVEVPILFACAEGDQDPTWSILGMNQPTILVTRHFMTALGGLFGLQMTLGGLCRLELTPEAESWPDAGVTGRNV